MGFGGSGDLEPAPLDDISLFNGLLKYDHPQYTITNREVAKLLSWLDQLYGFAMETPMWTPDRAYEELNKTKASGPPFSYVYGATKGEVMAHLSVQEMFDHFMSYGQYSDATLKDELRPKGKDARFFTPVAVQVAVVGNYLFGAQNSRIARFSENLPIKIGLQCPGFGMYNLWQKLRKHDGEAYHYDGRAFDSTFPIILAEVDREFRMSHMDLNAKPFVDRDYTVRDLVMKYYSVVYNGFVNVGGFLFNLIGQMTGQTNTASTNSIGNLCVVMLHAMRHHLSFEDFLEVLVYVMGDDLVIKDVYHIYDPPTLSLTYASLGMYLESPCVKPAELTEIQFCGCSPMWRKVGDVDQLLYCFKTDKLLSSLNWCLHSDANSYAMKLTSILSLLFANKGVFETYREKAREWFSAHDLELTQSSKKLVGFLSDRYLLKLLTGYESTGLSKFSFFLGKEESSE